MKKIMKKNIFKNSILALMLLGMLSLLFVGCKKDDTNNKINDNINNEDVNKEDINKENINKENINNEDTGEDIELDIDVNIGVIKGPTGMGMSKLIDDLSKEESLINYDFTIAGSPDELVAKIINGEIDIAALPTNLASVLYNKTEGEIMLAAINTLGVSYILENGNEIGSIKDLMGKKVWVSGKGSVPEYTFTHLLKENGIDPEKDLEIDYSLGHEELAAAVAAGDAKIAVLPQPHVTTSMMKNQDIRIALDINKEWEQITNTENSLAMGCIVVNKGFAEKNKNYLDSFLEKYENSVNWVNENPEEAGIIIGDLGILPNEKVATKAIPNSSLVFIKGQDAKNILEEFYSILFEIDPKALGGKLPDEKFYY